jgi:DNA-binding transcriptional ArsR family regulator
VRKVIDRTAQWLSVVEFDPELRAHDPGFAPSQRARLVARTVHLAAGPLDPRALVSDPRGWLGLMILDGLVLVEIEAGRAPTGWLVGADDFLRPWEMSQLSLTRNATWRVLDHTRLALLDGDFARRLAVAPATVGALLQKAAQTTHWLLAKSLIIATPVIEERLLLLFALLGERWGRVTAHGVVLDLPLTHRLIAGLIGARRPSVSTALGALAEAELVTRAPGGEWVIRRSVAYPDPQEPRVWRRYVEALGLDEGRADAVTARTADVSGGYRVGI